MTDQSAGAASGVMRVVDLMPTNHRAMTFPDSCAIGSLGVAAQQVGRGYSVNTPMDHEPHVSDGQD